MNSCVALAAMKHLAIVKTRLSSAREIASERICGTQLRSEASCHCGSASFQYHASTARPASSRDRSSASASARLANQTQFAFAAPSSPPWREPEIAVSQPFLTAELCRAGLTASTRAVTSIFLRSTSRLSAGIAVRRPSSIAKRVLSRCSAEHRSFSFVTSIAVMASRLPRHAADKLETHGGSEGGDGRFDVSDGRSRATIDDVVDYAA